MTGTFRSNNSYNNFLLLLYGALLKLPIFLYPKVPQPQQIDGFLYKALLEWLQPIGKGLPAIYPLIAFFLLYTQAVYFNKVVNDQRIMQRPHYLTGMSYLLISSLFTEWNMLSSPLIINSLLIWVWAKMSGLYSNQNPKSALFNIGIAIGISTFFLFSFPGFCSPYHFRIGNNKAF